MDLELNDAVDLALLTSGYALLDWLLRRDGWVRALRGVGLRRSWMARAAWVAPWLLLSPAWGWQEPLRDSSVRLLSVVMLAMLAWSAASKDIDVAVGEAHWFSRALLVASAIGAYFSPAFLMIGGFLLTCPFGLWEHHATLPMRLLQALMVHVCLAALAPSPLAGGTALFFFLLIIQISHYLITALAKCLLGRRWYSWVTENRLHHLAASAYSWGWARFIPWPRWREVVSVIRRVEKPLQLAAFALELLSPLALLHPRAAIGSCLAWSAFHLGVFALSGLLFWEWVLTDLALAYVLSELPAAVTHELFGPVSVALGLLFMLAFPLRHKLYKPMPLAWFDSPLTQRIHWTVQGQSGQRYGLYNHFMCPHERLYGKVHGCFLVPVPVVTYQLGEVYKAELRDAIRAAGPSVEALEGVRRRFGILPRDERMTERHVAYLRRFFQQLNRGARKHVLPRRLRWLKAPGGQIYPSGDLPPFVGQEPARHVSLVYREEYFDGAELRRLRNEVVLDIDIEAVPAPDPVCELTPKEVDDFLLGWAVGRLIDLPGFRRRYMHGDDGKRPTVEAEPSP